jgi:hypothetical protein
MSAEPITEKIDSHTFSGPVDVEKSDRAIRETDTPDGSLIEAPPMTFKRLMVLFSLTNLFIGAGVAVLFLGAGLSIPLIYTSNCRRLYCRRHWWWKLGSLAWGSEYPFRGCSFTDRRFHLRSHWPTSCNSPSLRVRLHRMYRGWDSASDGRCDRRFRAYGYWLRIGGNRWNGWTLGIGAGKVAGVVYGMCTLV